MTTDAFNNPYNMVWRLETDGRVLDPPGREATIVLYGTGYDGPRTQERLGRGTVATALAAYTDTDGSTLIGPYVFVHYENDGSYTVTLSRRRAQLAADRLGVPLASLANSLFTSFAWPD